ncbi:MAG: exosortase [Novosphingobium sp.]
MAEVSQSVTAIRARTPFSGKWLLANAPLLLGIAALVIPTVRDISKVSWSTEQGAHGPIVLAIACWLLYRAWPTIQANRQAGRAALGVPVLVLMLTGYVVTNVIGSVVLESATLYGALVSVLYLYVGSKAMRAAWFPLCYFLFVLPPPGSLIAAATQPLRLGISNVAVLLLSVFGFPVAREGLMIYIAQYTLEVKTACGGLNSMISLTAIGLFYGYAMHRLTAAYGILLMVVSILIAILANFLRVVISILMAYYLGDGAVTGFSHDIAGITMFVIAVIGFILFDRISGPLRRRLGS